jgi:argininosuccinate synthase
MKRIVLAYSSALEPVSDTPPVSDAAARGAIAWLADRYGAEIVTVTLDFGQGRELEALRDRALAAGAVRAHVLDVGGPFAARFLLPTLRAGALYAAGKALTTGLGRALIAQKLVEIATIEQTTTVAHGCEANDGRVAASVRALDPRLKVIALPTSGPGGEGWAGPRMATQGDTPSEPAALEEPAPVPRR